MLHVVCHCDTIERDVSRKVHPRGGSGLRARRPGCCRRRRMTSSSRRTIRGCSSSPGGCGCCAWKRNASRSAGSISRRSWPAKPACRSRASPTPCTPRSPATRRIARQPSTGPSAPAPTCGKWPWCSTGVSPLSRKTSRGRWPAGSSAPSRTISSQSGVSAVRDRVLAAVALAGHRPSFSEAQLRLVVEKWWRGEIVPGLQGRRDVLRLTDLPALLEILHAIRDNLKIDLRDPVEGFFRDLPS